MSLGEQDHRKAEKLRESGLRIKRINEWVEQRSRFLGKVLRVMQSWAMWEFRHDVLRTVLSIVALLTIGAGAASIEGWTRRSELKFVIAGSLFLGMLAWVGRKREKDLLLLYRIMEKAQTEWKSMVFDIRLRYVHELHAMLEKHYPGVEVYGRYRKKGSSGPETTRRTYMENQELDWENRAGVKLKAICFKWEEDEKEVRVEYRQTPAQVYAARFLQTRGISSEEHDRLKRMIEEGEWKTRPKFHWVCKLGPLGWSIAIVGLLAAIVLWGGIDTFADEDGGLILRYQGVAVIRAMLGQTAIMVAVWFLFVSLRAYWFPAGVFRIDEEEGNQKRRENNQKWILRSLLLGTLAVMFEVGRKSLFEVCSSDTSAGLIEASGTLERYIIGTNVCKMIEVANSIMN